MADDDKPTPPPADPPKGDPPPVDPPKDPPKGDPPADPPKGDDAPKGDDVETWKSNSRKNEDAKKAEAKRAAAAEKARDDALAERDKLSGVLDAFRKALDPDGAAAGEDDPVKVAEQAGQERDQARGEARLARVELSAERAARKAGADVDTLLDSRAFLGRLEKLDPTADTFAADVETAVAETLEANPRYKADPGTPPPPGPTSGQMGGGEGGRGTTPLTIDERREARRKRRAD